VKHYQLICRSTQKWLTNYFYGGVSVLVEVEEKKHIYRRFSSSNLTSGFDQID